MIKCLNESIKFFVESIYNIYIYILLNININKEIFSWKFVTVTIEYCIEYFIV